MHCIRISQLPILARSVHMTGAELLEQRYRRHRSSQAYDLEKRGGMKRVDFLMGKTKFLGLAMTSHGSDVWRLSTVGLSSQLVDLGKTHHGREGTPFAPQIGDDKASLSMDISTSSL